VVRPAATSGHLPQIQYVQKFTINASRYICWFVGSVHNRQQPSVRHSSTYIRNKDFAAAPHLLRVRLATQLSQQLSLCVRLAALTQYVIVITPYPGAPPKLLGCTSRPGKTKTGTSNTNTATCSCPVE
jgi:hypothetical protein